MKERAHCFTILDLSYACFQVIQGQVADLILEAVQIHLDLGAETQSKKTGRGKANDGLIGRKLKALDHPGHSCQGASESPKYLSGPSLASVQRWWCS